MNNLHHQEDQVRKGVLSPYICLLVIVGVWSFSASAFSDNSLWSSHRVSMLGLASWYSNADRGIGTHTANRETFSDKKNACAIWNLPFNSLVRVTNLANGKSIVVRVNDRGPSKYLVRKGRLIDLTKAAFSKIAELDEGLIEIEMVVLN